MDNNSPENSYLDFIKGIRDIGDVPYSPSIIPQILEREAITIEDLELFGEIQRIITIVGES